MEIRKAPNDTAALSFVANSEAARYVFVVVAAADVMIAGRRYGTFVLACHHAISCSTPTTNSDVLRRGAATDLMGQVGDALAAPRSAYVHVQRST